MRTLTILGLAAVAAAAVPCSAQQRQIEGHANYANTVQSHQNSWGAGASYQLTWGGQSAAVQLGTSLAADYQKQENGGMSQTSASYDMTLQPGGNSTVTPYVGGSVGANWLSGPGAPSGAQLGLQYILGAALKLERQAPLAVRLEVRPGYVKTQEHTVTGRLGVSLSM